MKSTRTAVVVVLGIVVLLAAATGFARECPEHVGELDWPYDASFHAIAAWDDYAVVATNNEIRVIDVSDPAHPVATGRLNTNFFAHDLTVSDGRLYVASDGGLRIIDITIPTDPVHVGGLDTPGSFEVAGSSSHAYSLGSGDADSPPGTTLRIIDASVPEEPVEVGSLDIPGGRDVAVAGGHAFVAAGDHGLRIIDVSDPSQPVEVGTHQVPGIALGVDLSNGYAHVTTVPSDRSSGEYSLVIIDVSDPATPVDVGIFSGESLIVTSAVVFGGHAYVTTIPSDWPWGEYSLVIIDVSDPTDPTEAGSVESPGYPSDLAASDGRVFVTSGGGLRIFDVADPGRPFQGRSYKEPSGVASAVVVSDGYAYVATLPDFWSAGFGSLLIIDVSDPSFPVVVGIVDTPWYATDVAVSGGYAYVVASGGLRIIDVSNPTDPVDAGHTAILEDASPWAVTDGRVAVSDGYAVVAATTGLSVIDISDPADPVEVGRHDFPGLVLDLAVSSRHAFVAIRVDDEIGTFWSIRVVDVSDPTHPFEVGQAEIPEDTTGMVVSGDHAHIVSNHGLSVFDVSNPAEPIATGHVGTHGNPIDVAVLDGVVYVPTVHPNPRGCKGPCGGPWLEVVDVTNPTNPTVVSVSEVWVGSIAISDPYIYMTRMGFHIYSNRCSAISWMEMAAHVDGQDGTVWRTDVAALNTSALDADLELVLRTPDDVASLEHTIPGLSQAVFEDVVGMMIPHGKGTLEVRTNRHLAIVGRTCSSRGPGTFGHLVDSHGVFDGLTRGQAVRLLGLRQLSGRYRTHIIVANISSRPAEVEMTLHATDGTTLESYPLAVEPGMVTHDLEPFKVRAGRPDLGWGFAMVKVVRGHGVLTSASVIDSRTTSATRVTGTPVTRSPPSSPSYAVTASSSHAYSGSGDRLLVADISDPTSPRNVGSVRINGTARSVSLSGPLAYVAAEDGGLRIIDVSAPEHPVEIGFFDSAGRSFDVALSGGLAYLADGHGGLRVIDVSAPDQPVEVGAYFRTGSEAIGVVVSGSLAYVADSARLRILDVSTPSDPTMAGILPLWDVTTGALDVAVEGRHAFVAGCEGGLRVVDVSDPSSPIEVGSINTPGCATSVMVIDQRAYVGVDEGGLRIIDVSDPTDPVEVDFHDPSAAVSDVWISNGMGFLAEGARGLEILAIDGANARHLSRLLHYDQIDWAGWLEIAAHLPGRAGSEWRTDVVAMNQAQYDAELEFILHTTGHDPSTTNMVPAEHQGVFQDIVGAMGDHGFGALEIRSDAPLAIAGSIYTASSAGTAGDSLVGCESSKGLAAGDTAWLAGLRQMWESWRTNIIVTNLGDGPAKVGITLYNNSGDELASYSIRVQPKEVKLDEAPFANRAWRLNTGWGFARVMVEKGRDVFIKAAVIDSRTNDAISVPTIR